MTALELDGEHLTLEDVVAVARGRRPVALAPEAWARVRRSREAVERLLARGAVIYGVTTGFGHLRNIRISPEQASLLQHNLLQSHAVGVGPELSEEQVRAMMVARLNSLARGHSGVRPEVLQLLIEMLNRGVHPVVPAQGSLGASGDLAPLAHMALPMIGLGEAIVEGRRLPGAAALEAAGLRPLRLEAKEGLALINGTAFMAGIGALVTYDAEILVQTADVVGAMTLEALEGSAVPFDERLHRVRPHPRQMDCAAFLRALLEGSELLSDPQRPSRVQDAYSLRCMPQVHGAVRDVVAYARWALEIELNSATDNPLIFWEEGEAEPAVLSGGNFHGELIALAMDYLAIGLAELANISERRLNRLLDPAENEGRYPPFLALEPGLHSGFMLVQYTAAALASENKVLAHPASVDTIPSSANTEDHVSMGATAVRHAEMVLRNAQRVVAAELFAAGQAIDLRRRQAGRPLRMGKRTAAAYALLRQHVPFLEADTVMAPWMERACRLVAEGHLLRAAQEGIAGLHAE
jgi:histidine ammonia-lyase